MTRFGGKTLRGCIASVQIALTLLTWKLFLDTVRWLPNRKGETTILVVIIIITPVEEEEEEERVMNGRPESGSSRSSSDAAKARWSPPSPNRTDGIRRVGYLLPFYLSPILIEGSKASRCVYSLLLQLLMWSLHVVPKAVTGLLPLVDGPLLGIMTTGSVAPEYLSEPVLSLALTLMLLSAVEQRTDLVPRLSLTLCARFGLRRRALFAFVCSVAFLGATMVSGAALALPLMWITDRVLEFLHVEQLDRALLLQTPSSDRRPFRRSLDSLSAPSVRDAEALLTKLATAMARIEQRVPRHRRRKGSLATPTEATASEVRPDPRPSSSMADDSRKMAPRSSSLADNAADGYVLKQISVPRALSHRDHSPEGLTAWAAMLMGNTVKPTLQDAAISRPQGQDAIAASVRRAVGVPVNESTRAMHGVPNPAENSATARKPTKEHSGQASGGSSTGRSSLSSASKGLQQRQTNRRLSIVDFKQTPAPKAEFSDLLNRTCLKRPEHWSEATPENVTVATISAAESPAGESATLATVNTFVPPMRKPPWAQRLLLQAELGVAIGRKNSSLDSLCSSLARASSIGQYQAMLDIQRRKEAVDRKHVAIRSAFLLAVAIVTALGNIVSLARLPTRKMLTKQHASRDEMLLSTGPMGQLQWTLIAIPGSVVAFLLSCCYFYTKNLSPYEPSNPEENSVVQSAAKTRLKLLSTPIPGKIKQQQWSQSHYISSAALTYLMLLAISVLSDFLALQLSFLAMLNLVAASLYQLTPRAPTSLEPDGRRVTPPWDVVFIAGGAQAISRFTSECDLLGGLVRGVSDNFWQQRSPLMNQALLCLAICLVAEASRTDKKAQFFALPFALCASTNLVIPVSLPIILVHGFKELDLTQLVRVVELLVLSFWPTSVKAKSVSTLSVVLMVGVAIKVVLVAGVLLSMSTTGPLLPLLDNAVGERTSSPKTSSARPTANHSSLSY
ncbi:uncharacterized protein [Dermacentor albipictus]|uniref:uncharacterized protein isoform X3 n=1 Tax=Dermacentor albipictus TaxID=60249 RepID=UPI0038FCF12A